MARIHAASSCLVELPVWPTAPAHEDSPTPIVSGQLGNHTPLPPRAAHQTLGVVKLPSPYASIGSWTPFSSMNFLISSWSGKVGLVPFPNAPFFLSIACLALRPWDLASSTISLACLRISSSSSSLHSVSNLVFFPKNSSCSLVHVSFRSCPQNVLFPSNSIAGAIPLLMHVRRQLDGIEASNGSCSTLTLLKNGQSQIR